MLPPLYDPKKEVKVVSDPTECDFLDENFRPAKCSVEWDTHTLVRKVIKPGDTVIELGGRYNILLVDYFA